MDTEGVSGESEVQEAVAEAPVESQETAEPAESSNDQLGEYGSQFLNGIEDENLKQQLAPYVQKWDAGVTRRFQDIHKQYEPYKQLGEVEQLQRASKLFEMVNNDPTRVLNALAQSLNYKLTPAQQAALAEADEDIDPIAEKLTPVQQKLEQQQKVLERVAQFIQNQQQEQQKQQEQQSFNEYLNLLEREKGSFDRDYVTALIAQGVDPAEAVDRFQQTVQQALNANSRKQPPVLSGGGSVPTPNKDVRSLSKQDTKNLVASMLQAAD